MKHPIDLNEVERLCKPVVAYLKKEGSIHDTVINTMEQIKITTDEASVPVQD